MKRRTFVKNTAMAAATVHILPTGSLYAESKKVKLGFIGTGLRGQSHLENALRREDVEIVAICDVDDQMLQMATSLFKKSGKAVPKIFTGDPYAWKKLLEIREIEGVIIATPWEWHTPMAIESLEAGKYVGTEVCLGITMEDLWNVVRTCERTKGNLMMLENVCYRRDVIAVMNMVRQGLFGELLHMQAGYQHDLRGVKFNNGNNASNSPVEFGKKLFQKPGGEPTIRFTEMETSIRPMALVRSRKCWISIMETDSYPYPPLPPNQGVCTITLWKKAASTIPMRKWNSN